MGGAQSNNLVKRKTKQEEQRVAERKTKEEEQKEFINRMNSFLAPLEEQAQCVLNDEHVKVTGSQTKDRVLLEVQEEMLQDLLDQLQGGLLENQQHYPEEKVKAELPNTAKYYYSQLELIAALRAEKNEAKQMLTRVKASHAAQTEEQKTENNRIAAALKDTSGLLENQRHYFREKVTKTQSKLKHQEGNITQLKDALQKAEQELQEKSRIEAELPNTAKYYEAQLELIAALRAEKDEAKWMLTEVEASHAAQIEEQKAETSRIAAALKETKDLLKNQRHYVWEKVTKTQSKLKHHEESITQHKDALQKAEQELQEKSAALKEKKDLLETQRLLFQKESVFAQQLENSQINHLAELEMQKNKHSEIVAALKKTFQDQIAKDRLVFQKERSILENEHTETKIFYRSQLQIEKERRSVAEAALAKAKQQLDSQTTAWRKDKWFFRETLQEKEEQWATTERSLRSRLEQFKEGLEDQVTREYTIFRQERSSLLQDTESIKQTPWEKEQWETTKSSLRSRLERFQSKIPKKKTSWFKKHSTNSITPL